MDLPSVARVTLLDGFTLHFAHGRPGPEREALPRSAQRLVAYLGLRRASTRTAVAGLLWPDVPESHAHGSLRSTLWRVHKIAPGLVTTCGDALALADGVRIDVRELVVWSQRVADPGTPLRKITATGARLRGELLPGWYDDWVLLERERVRQLRLHALESLADRLAAEGRYGEAVQAASAAVALEPLRESAHRAVIRVHLAEGNVVEAVRAYDACRRLLAEELGVAPTRQMDDLMHLVPPQRRRAGS